MIVEFYSRVARKARAEADLILRSITDSISLSLGTFVSFKEYKAAASTPKPPLKTFGNANSNAALPGGSKAATTVDTPGLKHLNETGRTYVMAIRFDSRTGDLQLVGVLPD